MIGETREGEVRVRGRVRRISGAVDLRALSPEYEARALAAAEVGWIARIIWARQ